MVPSTLDYCFHSGYTENVENSNKTLNVELWGPTVPAGNQMDLCMQSLREQLLLEGNQMCDMAYDGECAFKERYQPQLAQSQLLGFVGMSALQFAMTFLNVPMTSSISTIKAAGADICSMTFSDIMGYYENNPSFIPIRDISINLPYFCFISSYITVNSNDYYFLNFHQKNNVVRDFC